MLFAMTLQFSNISVKRTLRIKSRKSGYLKRYVPSHPAKSIH